MKTMKSLIQRYGSGTWVPSVQQGPQGGTLHSYNYAWGYPGVTGSQGIPDDTSLSKEYLLNMIMNQFGITSEDLKELSKVKVKIREKNINEIVNDTI